MAVLDGVAAPARAARVRPRGASRRERWLRRLPLLPALIYVVVVTQAPFVVTVWYSFQSYFWDIPGGAHFTGLSNYSAVFTDPAFRGSLLRSVIMTASAVIVAMILGVLLAVLLDRKFFGRGVARTLIITPFLVMPAAAALIWAYPMLDANYGLVNYLLAAVRRQSRGLAQHPATALGDHRHDLAVDAVHDLDRAGRPAESAARHA